MIILEKFRKFVDLFSILKNLIKDLNINSMKLKTLIKKIDY
jgi:hypothetical protein